MWVKLLEMFFTVIIIIIIIKGIYIAQVRKSHKCAIANADIAEIRFVGKLVTIQTFS